MNCNRDLRASLSLAAGERKRGGWQPYRAAPVRLRQEIDLLPAWCSGHCRAGDQMLLVKCHLKSHFRHRHQLPLCLRHLLPLCQGGTFVKFCHIRLCFAFITVAWECRIICLLYTKWPVIYDLFIYVEYWIKIVTDLFKESRINISFATPVMS